jgi:uncharacterized protein YkwD
LWHASASLVTRRLSIAALGSLVALALTTAPATAASCANADLQPTKANLAKVRTATLCLLNAERKKQGRSALKSNAKLAGAGNRFARSMVTGRFFDHVSPSGSTPEQRIKATGYTNGARSWAIGENIAWGSGSLATPRNTVRGWMKSPPHKANILSRNFDEIGIGVAYGAPQRGVGQAATYATEFGARG